MPGTQNSSDFVIDQQGNIMVFWHDARDHSGIYTQKLSNLDGTRMLNPVQGKAVSSGETGEVQLINSIINDENNGAYLSWVAYNNNTTKWTGYIQRINNNGDPVWTDLPGQTVTYAPQFSSQYAIYLFKAPINGIIIIFIEEYDEAFGGDIIIRPDRWDSMGGIGGGLWGAVANSSPASLMFANSNTTANTNVFWYDTSSTGGLTTEGGLRAQSINSSGDILWGSDGIVLLDSLLYLQSIASSDGGTVLVGLGAFSDPPLYDIYAQKVGSNGRVLWGNRGVEVSAASGVQDLPWRFGGFFDRGWHISDNQGGAIFVWEDKRNADKDIYAQRVTNLGLLGNITYPESISFNSRLEYENKSQLSDYDSTDYQIWGFPGDGSKMIHEIFPGTHLEDWQIYWDNGDSVNNLKEYNRFDSETFTPGNGKAYWALYKGDLNINEADIPSVKLNSQFEIAIPLHDGWNLISNPVNTDILWSHIQGHNNIFQEIFFYKKGYITSSFFRPGIGYYFKNISGLDSLRIPLQSISSPNKLAVIDSSFIWRSKINFFSGSLVDHTASFGVIKAPDMRNHFELFKPKGFSPGVSLDFITNNQSLKSVDYKENHDSLKVWKIQTTQLPNIESHLIFKNLDEVPDDISIILLSENGHTSTDLKADSIYSYKSPNKTSIHYIIVGQEKEAYQIIDHLQPSKLILADNYPNPFNGTTTIPIEFPTNIFMELSIYNLLGQRIKLIYQGNINKGRYSFTWDGKNEAEINVTSGIYFYTLKTSNEILSKKLIYTR